MLYVLFISMPLTGAVLIDSTQNTSDKLAAPLVDTQPSTKPIASASPSPVASPSPSTLKIEQGTDPDTIVMVFPSGTSRSIVDATIGSLELSVISGDSASGRYVVAIPQVRLYPDPGSSDNAWVYFPKIYSSEDGDAYLAANGLTLIRWSRDPETNERFALVQVPRLEAKLVDAQRGYYSITLRPTDAASLAAWAAESGVRIIRYDAATGETGTCIQWASTHHTVALRPDDGTIRHGAKQQHEALRPGSTSVICCVMCRVALLSTLVLCVWWTACERARRPRGR